MNVAVAGRLREGHVASQDQPSGAQPAWGQQQRLQPAPLHRPAGGQPLHWPVAGSAEGSTTGQLPCRAEADREAGRSEQPLHWAEAGLAEGSSTGPPLHQDGLAEGGGSANRLQQWPEADSEAGSTANLPSPQSDVSPRSLPVRARKGWPAPPSGSLSVDQDFGDMLQTPGAGKCQGCLNASLLRWQGFYLGGDLSLALATANQVPVHP